MPDYKTFKLRLPTPLYEDFYRLFPGKGERQNVLRKLTAILVQRSKKETEFWKDIVESMREQE